MWTIDARCAQCKHKDKCADRKKIMQTLSPLANELNTEEQFVDGPGDGILVVACREFAI